MASTSVLVSEGQAAISPFGRVIGVFFSPKATFEDIVRKPSWILPAIVLTVFSFVVCVGINQRINWRQYITAQIEKNPDTANMSAEQKEQRVEGGVKFAPPFTYAIGVVAPIAAILIVALVLWGAYNLLGGANTNFSTSMGITSHAFLTGLVSSLLYLLILYLKPYNTVDLDNPIAANVAAFLSDDAPKWLVALGASLDLFSFWNMILLAIGFGTTNPRKLRGGKAFTIVFTVWAVYVVLKVGRAFIFS
jgi:hypothetical protein